MSDRVDEELLNNIKSRIEKLEVDDLRMNQQSLAEALFKRKWFNPFPKFKFTERPDTAAACLLEGKVVITVDNSPSAMILPTSVLDMIEEANDYYFPTLTGMYLKISNPDHNRNGVFTPLYLLYMQNPQWLPGVFSFVMVRDQINLPLIRQFLLLELSIDGLRLYRDEYANDAQYSTECNRRYCDGRIFGRIRLVQFRSNAIYGICGSGKLYTAEFRTWICIKIYETDASCTDCSV